MLPEYEIRYAKIDATTWDHQSPTRSSLKGCDREFDHERNCPRYERMDKDCDCYVSRIRLVKTPVGEFIPTTEPDLNPDLNYWRWYNDLLRDRAEHMKLRWIIVSVGFALAATTNILYALEVL